MIRPWSCAPKHPLSNPEPGPVTPSRPEALGKRPGPGCAAVTGMKTLKGMTGFRWAALALASLACLAPLPAVAAETLDLARAWQAALQNDARLQAARSATEARRERVPQARAQLLPNLSAQASENLNALRRTAPGFLGAAETTRENYASHAQSVTLRHPLYRPALDADLRQANAQVQEAEAVLEQETQNLAVRVSGAYFEALLAEEQLTLIQAQQAAYAAQLDAAQKRMKAGMGTRTDIDEAQAALDFNVAQELEARQNLDFTRRQLQVMVGEPVLGLARVDPARLRLVPPSPPNLQDWIDRAEVTSAEIQGLKAQVEAARHAIDKARAGGQPTLDAIGQIVRSDRDTVTSVNSRYTNASLGLQLAVPLYNAGFVNSTVRQAILDEARAEQSLEAARRDLGLRLHREFRAITEGVARVRALEQAVRSAEQVVISNRRAFEAGSRTLLDTLNAEQLKVTAQRDLAAARLTYLSAQIRLQALSGGPVGEVLEAVNEVLRR